jgi:4-hydroxy-tetrahydrodipicolinate synthase
MALQLRGIFSIPASPFDEIGELDFDGLRRQVEFSIACGAGAVIGPVMASEVWRLTLEERQRFVEVLVRQAAGRLPVIAGVSARNAEESVELARCAAAAGAEAVIAMLPSPEMSSNWEETHRFFSTLAERAGP